MNITGAASSINNGYGLENLEFFSDFRRPTSYILDKKKRLKPVLKSDNQFVGLPFHRNFLGNLYGLVMT